MLGPPGVGKSRLIHQIGGWPDEICVDISRDKWWTVEALTHRPREIHLALPFEGLDESASVYDDRWKGVEAFPEPDFARICIPRKKKFILAPNWRAKFVFDFILPPPAWLFANRRERLSSNDVRLVDMDLTEAWIAWQIHTHWRIARFFHQAGLQTMVRPFNTVRPYSFPLLKKISKKSTKPCREEITPGLDWSRVRCVKRWITEASPGIGDLSTGGEAEDPRAMKTRGTDRNLIARQIRSYTALVPFPVSVRQQLLAIESGVAAAGRMLSLRRE